jgi:hypothetical protein
MLILGPFPVAGRGDGQGREGIKKAGGPIWPTALALPFGGQTACG